MRITSKDDGREDWRGTRGARFHEKERFPNRKSRLMKTKSEVKTKAEVPFSLPKVAFVQRYLSIAELVLETKRF